MHPNLAAACSGSNCTFSAFIYQWQPIINSLLGILAALAVAVFFFGIVRFIFSPGDAQGHRQGYRLLGWGIVALFVLFTLGGILNFFASDIFGTSVSSGGASSVSQ